MLKESRSWKIAALPCVLLVVGCASSGWQPASEDQPLPTVTLEGQWGGTGIARKLLSVFMGLNAPEQERSSSQISLTSFGIVRTPVNFDNDLAPKLVQLSLRVYLTSTTAPSINQQLVATSYTSFDESNIVTNAPHNREAIKKLLRDIGRQVKAHLALHSQTVNVENEPG